MSGSNSSSGDRLKARSCPVLSHLSEEEEMEVGGGGENYTQIITANSNGRTNTTITTTTNTFTSTITTTSTTSITTSPTSVIKSNFGDQNTSFSSAKSTTDDDTSRLLSGFNSSNHQRLSSSDDNIYPSPASSTLFGVSSTFERQKKKFSPLSSSDYELDNNIFQKDTFLLRRNRNSLIKTRPVSAIPICFSPEKENFSKPEEFSKNVNNKNTTSTQEIKNSGQLPNLLTSTSQQKPVTATLSDSTVQLRRLPPPTSSLIPDPTSSSNLTNKNRQLVARSASLRERLQR